jgi:hypothetical protein
MYHFISVPLLTYWASTGLCSPLQIYSERSAFPVREGQLGTRWLLTVQYKAVQGSITTLDDYHSISYHDLIQLSLYEPSRLNTIITLSAITTQYNHRHQYNYLSISHHSSNPILPFSNVQMPLLLLLEAP